MASVEIYFGLLLSLTSSLQDWKYHKKYCGKYGIPRCNVSQLQADLQNLRKMYRFKIKIIGSRKPAIVRTVDVPSWYTFQWFHFVIQYAFGPWQQCHPHEFYYTTEASSLTPPQTVLRIVTEGGVPRPSQAKGRSMFEKQLKLEDVYGRAGKYHSLVVRDGGFLPLKYLYDFKV